MKFDEKNVEAVLLADVWYYVYNLSFTMEGDLFEFQIDEHRWIIGPKSSVLAVRRYV